MIKLSFLTETGNYLEYYINPSKVNCIKTLRDNSDSISGELEIVLDNKTLKFLKTDLSVVNEIVKSVYEYNTEIIRE